MRVGEQGKIPGQGKEEKAGLAFCSSPQRSCEDLQTKGFSFIATRSRIPTRRELHSLRIFNPCFSLSGRSAPSAATWV